jgi:HK97 family phage major capsid protein
VQNKKQTKKEKSEMNLIQQQKEELRSKIAALTAKPSLTSTERSQLNALISTAADIRATEERQTRASVLVAQSKKDLPVIDTDEVRQARHEGAFRKYLRGNDSEIRTYTPMTTAGVSIPELFASKYTEQLKSFSGIRQVATVIETTNGDALKNPFANDSNIGERLNENDPVSLSNPTFNKTTFVAYRYSSKGVQYSAQLLQDAGIPVEDYLSKVFARRIGKLTNQEFTLGGSGAMTGVIPSITSVNTSASPTAVTVGEIVDLQNIDEAYLSGAVYMFNPATERALKKMTGTDGLPTFPEMRTARVLCGFPYVLNVDMASIAASQKAIAFGNFSHAVVIRSVVPSLLVSKERYAEINQLFAALRNDQDCQVVDPAALQVLQQHA